MGVKAVSSTHPVESVIVLPAIVVAVFALDSERIVRYQLPRQRVGREIITYDFLEMRLAEESICDFDGCSRHGQI